MDQVKPWYLGVRRIAKLFMVENDPMAYDRDFWIDYFEKTCVDAVNLCAGGIVAFYPTKLPFHRKSRWMGDTDPFGELVAIAREKGLKIIARIDPHATHQESMDAHPEWIMRDFQGNPLRHASNPELWLACTKGPYYFEFMAGVIREITEMYMVEGFHVNRWEGMGMCYCQSCRDDFRTFCGRELPYMEKPYDELWGLYNEWAGKKQLQIWDAMNDVAQSVSPHSYFLPNTYQSKIISAADIKERTLIMNIDYQSRGLSAPIWDIGMVGKKVRGLVGEETPVLLGASPGFENFYRWKDSVRDAADYRLWYLDAIANGLDIAWGKFSAVLYDLRWLEPTQRLFKWHSENDHYLSNKRSAANAAIIYPAEKFIFPADGEPEEESNEYCLGIYHALLEGRIPFDMLHSDHISVESLSRYKVIILPNICRISDAQAQSLREYVKNGGRLVATYESSLYNEKGEMRTDFALSDVFGVRFVKRRAAYPIKNSYLNIKAGKNGEYHPILTGLEDAGRIIHSGRQLDVTPLSSADGAPLTAIPSYPDLPMEYVFPLQPETDIAEVYFNDFGKGLAVYYPWDLDRVYWEVASSDHGNLIRNTVRWLSDDSILLTVEGAGLLDVTCRIQADALVVHMVNLSNPMTMSGIIREFIPIGQQKLTVKIPDGKKVLDVKLLVKGGSLEYEQSGGQIAFTVESILDHEVIAIDIR